MNTLKEFLLKNEPTAGLEKEICLSDRFVNEAGQPLPFTIRALTAAQVLELEKTALKTSANPADYLLRLAAACVLEPNLKDAELQQRYGVMGADMLLGAMLLPGELQLLLKEVQNLHGTRQVTAEMVGQAKN